VQKYHQGCWRISNIKHIWICLTLFLFATWFHVCNFIVFMFSLLFYNVEKSKNKDKPLNE
jgi:hypothetical protein